MKLPPYTHLYSVALRVVSGTECEMLSLSCRRIHKSNRGQTHGLWDNTEKVDTVLSAWWAVMYKNKQ